MNLQDALQLLAMQLQLDPAELIRYAGEDTIGGYHWKADEQKWPMGSLFGVEGQILYALVRILKPAHVVEIGSLRGCSTAHLATALSVNGSGRLTAVDIAPDARDQFPKHLESVLTGVTADGLDWLTGQEDGSIDLLFEDSSHGTDMCAAVAELCKTKLAPGGVLVMHDAGHDLAFVGGGVQVPSAVGAEVRAGLDRALGTAYRVYLAEPSDCGVAVWQRNFIAPAGWGMIDAPEKPKREMITEDGERLEIIDDPAASGPQSVSVVEQAIGILTEALHDDESTEEKLKDFYPPTPPKPKRKPARKAKPKA